MSEENTCKHGKTTEEECLDCHWNAAIEACIEKLEQDFVAPNIVINLLRELRK